MIPFTAPTPTRVDLRLVGIRANYKTDDQRVAAVVALCGLHVQEARNTIHLFFDGLRNHPLHDGRARTGESGRHLDGRRSELWVLRDRQSEDGHRADQQGDQGNDVGENRPLDKELGDHDQFA